jgi:hypothetical protein
VRDLLQLSDLIYVFVVERFPHEFVMILRKTSCKYPILYMEYSAGISGKPFSVAQRGITFFNRPFLVAQNGIPVNSCVTCKKERTWHTNIERFG